MLAIRLPQSMKALEKWPGVPGSHQDVLCSREAIFQHLDELEDLYLAERSLERIRKGERTIPLANLLKRHGLEDRVFRRSGSRASQTGCSASATYPEVPPTPRRRLDDPRGIGKALQGPRLGEFWRYRSARSASYAKLRTIACWYWCCALATARKSIAEFCSCTACARCRCEIPVLVYDSPSVCTRRAFYCFRAANFSPSSSHFRHCRLLSHPPPFRRATARRRFSIEVLLDEPLGTISPDVYGHFTEHLAA